MTEKKSLTLSGNVLDTQSAVPVQISRAKFGWTALLTTSDSASSMSKNTKDRNARPAKNHHNPL